MIVSFMVMPVCLHGCIEAVDPAGRVSLKVVSATLG